RGRLARSRGHRRVPRPERAGEPVRAGGPRAGPRSHRQLPPPWAGAGDARGAVAVNLRVVRGFELETPPVERPAQRPRQPKVDERVPEQWPRDPVLVRLLGELDWSALLAQRPGWSF